MVSVFDYSMSQRVITRRDWISRTFRLSHENYIPNFRPNMTQSSCINFRNGEPTKRVPGKRDRCGCDRCVYVPYIRSITHTHTAQALGVV